MNCVGDELLAGAAFSGDENGCIDAGDAAHEIVNSVHLRAGSAHSVATALGGPQLLLSGLKFLLEDEVLMGAADQCFEISNGGGPGAGTERPGENQIDR